MSNIKRWITLAIVSSALLLIVMDMTILYTALPVLTHDLAASASEKLWIVNGYSLVMAGLLPAMGTLGDRLGYKKIFIGGLFVFGAASLIAAFSPTPAILVFSRVLLAVGASMMMPATLSIIRITFADPKELALALGIWASVSSGGAGLGPIVGGLLLEKFSWGSVFLINLPIVALALVLTLLYIPAHQGDKSKKWDWVSSVQIMVSLVLLVYAIKEISRREGSVALALTAFVVGAIAMVIFIRRQLARKEPLIDLQLFRNIRFSAAFVTAVVSSFAMLGLQFVLTQRLQLVEGLSPFQAGLFTLCIPVASFIVGPITGVVMHRIDPMRLKATALLVAAAGMALYIAQFNMSTIVQIAGLSIVGAGLGAAMTTASHSTMSNAPASKAGMAASIEEVAFELGGASGIAIIGSLSGFMYTLAMKVPESLTAPASVMDSIDEAKMFAEHLPADSAQMLVQAANTAFDSSFFFVVSAITGLLFVASAAIFVTGVRRRSKSVN